MINRLTRTASVAPRQSRLGMDSVVRVPIGIGCGTEPVYYRAQEAAIGTTWLLGSCMEARGKQDLWVKQRPEVLAALRDQAMIQSSESSNRIEGVTVSASRLRPLILGSARPRDRPEEELAGYRRALQWAFS